MKLSQRGYRLAVQDALLRQSIVAEVALAEDLGVTNGWPSAFREAAVGVYNERAESEDRGGIHSLPATEDEGHPGLHGQEGITVGNE